MSDLVERLRLAEHGWSVETECGGRSNGVEHLLREAADEIERLQDAKRRALAVADERSKENVGLRAALKDCSDDLADELEGRYAGMMNHPAMKSRYDRDMASVLVARNLLRNNEQKDQPPGFG